MNHIKSKNFYNIPFTEGLLTFARGVNYFCRRFSHFVKNGSNCMRKKYMKYRIILKQKMTVFAV